MNETPWLQGIHQLDSVKPVESVDGEPVYTLFLRDFLSMPNVDFGVVLKVDESVRALLN